MVRSFAVDNVLLMTLFFAVMLVQPVRDVLIPRLLGKMYDAIRENRPFDRYLYIVIILIVALQLSWIAADLIEVNLNPELRRHAMKTIMRHVFGQNAHDLKEVDSANVVARVVELPSATLSLFSAAKAEIIPAIISFLGAFGYLLYKDYRLALGLLIAVSVTMWGVYAVLKRCSTQAEDCQVDRATFAGHMDDVLRNMRAVVGLHAEREELSSIDATFERTKQTCSGAVRCTLSAKYVAIPAMLIFLVIAARYSFGKLQQGKATSGDMVEYLLIGFFVNSSVIKLTDIFEDVVHRWSVVQNALSVFEVCEPPTASDAALCSSLKLRGQMKGGFPPPPRRGIHLQNIWYSHFSGMGPQTGTGDAGDRSNANRRCAGCKDYKGSNKDTFKEKRLFRGLTVTIPDERITLIVGKVGCGKSTMLDLILGHKRPTCGTVYYDGVPLDTLIERKNAPRTFYVPQTPFLFNRTVYENIVYGLGNRTKELVYAGMKDFERSTGLPILRDFVDVLPSGLDTSVGLHGSQLSGGQRQLVWLSKLLFLNDVRVIVLDEPTASVDDRTKRIIRGLVQHVSKGKTVVMVTHDQKLLKLADNVLHLKRYDERGSGQVPDLQRK